MKMVQGTQYFDILNLADGSLFGAGANISTIINIVLWVLIISTGLIVIVKFVSHRVFVEILERVEGGYVCKGGRYALVHDRKTDLGYLRPMWGPERLPSFPMEAFQKTRGAPFIGIKRELSLIKLNKYSYKVSLPEPGIEKYGIVKYYDTLSWVFLEQRRKFLKKISKEQIFQTLMVLAPILVIVGIAGMVAWAIYVHARLDANYAAYLGELLKIAKTGG